MERLLQPDTGLMIWTVVTFLGLVLVLGKFAWKPLLQALNEREAGIKRAIEDAQGARAAAERRLKQVTKDVKRARTAAAKSKMDLADCWHHYFSRAVGLFSV